MRVKEPPASMSSPL